MSTAKGELGDGTVLWLTLMLAIAKNTQNYTFEKGKSLFIQVKSAIVRFACYTPCKIIHFEEYKMCKNTICTVQPNK